MRRPNRRAFNWAKVFNAPKPDRVFLERIERPNKWGKPGVIQRWTAESGREWHGTGRTRIEAERNMSNAYRMNFDEIAWKVRMSFGHARAAGVPA